MMKFMQSLLENIMKSKVKKETMYQYKNKMYKKGKKTQYKAHYSISHLTLKISPVKQLSTMLSV